VLLETNALTIKLGWLQGSALGPLAIAVFLIIVLVLIRR